MARRLRRQARLEQASLDSMMPRRRADRPRSPVRSRCSTEAPRPRVHFAALRWLVVDAPAPSLQGDLYFWVMLVSGSALVGAVASAWSERPWYDRRAS